MEQKKEWMIHVWGGAWNYDATPSIEQDYGIKEGYHYFDSDEDKNDFLEIINKPEYCSQGLMKDIKYGAMSHKRTIFFGTLQYEGTDFTIHLDFGYEYPEDSAIYMFLDGNYACDCNRSLFIRREYGENSIPELDCGDGITLVEYHIEYRD